MPLAEGDADEDNEMALFSRRRDRSIQFSDVFLQTRLVFLEIHICDAILHIRYDESLLARRHPEHY